MTQNGVSTTLQRGTEQYQFFGFDNQNFVQYDYRHTDGELFSCVASCLKSAHKKRDLWLERKQQKDGKK